MYTTRSPSPGSKRVQIALLVCLCAAQKRLPAWLREAIAKKEAEKRKEEEKLRKASGAHTAVSMGSGADAAAQAQVCTSVCRR